MTDQAHPVEEQIRSDVWRALEDWRPAQGWEESTRKLLSARQALRDYLRRAPFPSAPEMASQVRNMKALHQASVVPRVAALEASLSNALSLLEEAIRFVERHENHRCNFFGDSRKVPCLAGCHYPKCVDPLPPQYFLSRLRAAVAGAGI